MTAPGTKTQVLAYLQGLPTAGSSHRFVMGQLQENWPEWPVPNRPDIDQIAPLLAIDNNIMPGLIGIQAGNFSWQEDTTHWGPDQYDTMTNTVTALTAYWNAGSLIQIGFRPRHPVSGLAADQTPVNLTNLLNGTTTCTWFERGVTKTGPFTGILDWHVTTLLQPLKTNGVVVIQRLFEEMNLDGPGAYDWWWANFSAADFKTLWQYVVTYFRTTKALDNVLFAFHTFMDKGNNASYYPGDTYVDIVGFDLYTDATVPASQSDYVAFSSMGKPIMLGEFGFVEGGVPRDLNAWVESVKTNMPLLVGGMAWSEVDALHDQLNVATGMANAWLVNAPVSATGPLSPLLIGWLDSVSTSGVVVGWVGDLNNPSTRQTVTIKVAGATVGTVQADDYRADVHTAYPALDGNQGYTYQLPSQYLDGQSHSVAAFVGTTQLSGSPKTVTLTGTSYLWNFGDSTVVGGGTSTAQNPTWTYGTGGLKTVTHDVTKLGVVYFTATQTVAVLAAAFTAQQTSGTLNVTFTNTSYAPGATWLWSFGDQTTSPTASPTHQYMAANESPGYQVTLAATVGGQTYTATQYVSVTPSAPVILRRTKLRASSKAVV